MIKYFSSFVILFTTMILAAANSEVIGVGIAIKKNFIGLLMSLFITNRNEIYFLCNQKLTLTIQKSCVEIISAIRTFCATQSPNIGRYNLAWGFFSSSTSTFGQ